MISRLVQFWTYFKTKVAILIIRAKYQISFTFQKLLLTVIRSMRLLISFTKIRLIIHIAAIPTSATRIDDRSKSTYINQAGNLTIEE